MDGEMVAELLDKVMDDTDGALASFVMSFDGLPLEIRVRDESAPARAAGMEFSFVMTQVRKAAEILKVGALSEVAIRSEKFLFLLKVLNERYFFGLVLSPDANMGKGRFVMRITSDQLIAVIQKF